MKLVSFHPLTWIFGPAIDMNVVADRTSGRAIKVFYQMFGVFISWMRRIFMFFVKIFLGVLTPFSVELSCFLFIVV